jgi:hypothetical protein
VVCPTWYSTAKVLKILVTNGILTILSLVLTTHKAIESGECCEDLQIVVKKLATTNRIHFSAYSNGATH